MSENLEPDASLCRTLDLLKSTQDVYTTWVGFGTSFRNVRFNPFPRALGLLAKRDASTFLTTLAKAEDERYLLYRRQDFTRSILQ